MAKTQKITQDGNRSGDAYKASNFLPRSFFNETVELLRGYVPAIGGVSFGCGMLRRNLEQYAGEPIPEKADRIRCVRFPSGKEQVRPPFLGVIFASEGIEEAVRCYRHALVIVTDLQAFLRAYPKGQYDPRLKNVCLGGFVNLGRSPGGNAAGYALALLNAWVLCGPFFDSFRERDAFDLRYPSERAQFFDGFVKYITACWNENLRWSFHEEERILRIREKSEEFRRTSSTFLTFSQGEEVFQDRFADWLCRTGGMERITLMHHLGWDDRNRRWDSALKRMVEPEALLRAIEEKKPAFALETNCYNSLIQPFYHGSVSPAFALSRCGIPHHHIISDPAFSVNTFIWDLFSELFSRTSSAFLFTPVSDLSDSVRAATLHFPALLLSDADRSFKNSLQNSNFAKSCCTNKPLGFFIATNFRRETVKNVPIALRLLNFYLIITLRKNFDTNNISYNFFLNLLIEENESMYPILLEAMERMPFDVFCEAATATCGSWSNLGSLHKLNFAFDAVKTAQRLGVPIHIHCPGSWSGGDNNVWRGYLEKDEVENVGRSGWIRLSAYPQPAGEPYHDVNDALREGYVCLGVNAHREDETKAFAHVAPCTFTTPSVLRERMREALADPAGMFEKMKRAAAPMSWTAEEESRPCASPKISDMLRRFPYEMSTTGAPKNALSLLSLAPSLERVREEIAALEPYLNDPNGVSRYIQQLPDEEKEYAMLIRSYLAL